MKALTENGEVVATTADITGDAAVTRLKIRRDWILVFTTQNVVFLQYEPADRFVFRARIPLRGSVDLDLLFLAGVPTAVDADPKGVVQLLFLDKPIHEANLVQLQSEPFLYHGGISELTSFTRNGAFDAVHLRQPDGTIGTYECHATLVPSSSEKVPHTMRARWHRVDKWQATRGPGHLFHDERLGRPFTISDSRIEYPASNTYPAAHLTVAGGPFQIHPEGRLIAFWKENGGLAEVVAHDGAEWQPLALVDRISFR